MRASTDSASCSSTDSDGIKASAGEAGLQFTVDFGLGALNALQLGDIVSDTVYQVRPYETKPGETDRVFRWPWSGSAEFWATARRMSLSARPRVGDAKFESNKMLRNGGQRVDGKDHDHL